MADEWYDLATKNHFWMKSRFRNVINNLPIKLEKETKILEIGCGIGTFAEQLADKLDAQIDCCDLNHNALAQVNSRINKILFYNIHDKNENLKEYYDVIFLMDVLEHIKNDIEFINSCIYHLKVGGLLCINVPSCQFLFSKYDLVAGHKRRYNKTSLDSALRTSGLKVCKTKYWGFFAIPLLLIRKFILLFTADKKVINVGFKAYYISNIILSFMFQFEDFSAINYPIGTSIIAYAKKVIIL